jgi:hypothetical protein
VKDANAAGGSFHGGESKCFDLVRQRIFLLSDCC